MTELESHLAAALARVDWTRQSGLGALAALDAAGYRQGGRSRIDAVEVLERGEISTAHAFVSVARFNAGRGDGGVGFLRMTLQSFGYRILVADARIRVECSEESGPS